MGMLGQYFHSKEVECRCGCGLCEMDPKLMWALNRLRHELGRPVVVTSGHRCAKHNAAVGGRVNSFHLTGRAVDIRTATAKERWETLRLAFRLGFTGIGIGKGFVHLDVRDGEPWSDVY